MKIHDMSGWSDGQRHAFHKVWAESLGMAFGPMPPDVIDGAVTDLLSSAQAQMEGMHWEGYRYEDEKGASIWALLVQDEED